MMGFVVLVVVVVILATAGDTLSILWRQACDESRHHRAAFISALMYGLGLVDLLLVVSDLRFLVPLLVGEVAGSYVGIWVKDRLAARAAHAKLGP